MHINQTYAYITNDFLKCKKVENGISSEPFENKF